MLGERHPFSKDAKDKVLPKFGEEYGAGDVLGWGTGKRSVGAVADRVVVGCKVCLFEHRINRGMEGRENVVQKIEGRPRRMEGWRPWARQVL